MAENVVQIGVEAGYRGVQHRDIILSMRASNIRMDDLNELRRQLCRQFYEEIDAKPFVLQANFRMPGGVG